MENAVILGTFDGVHLGHRAVIEGARGCNITAISFELPPRACIEGKTELLMTPEDRADALCGCGVKETVFLKFPEVKDISAGDFLGIIKKKYSPSLICCGYNYRFGKNALGDTKLLREFCNDNGIKLKVADCVFKNGEAVSSTRIRRAVKNGSIELANACLLKKIGFKAEVFSGDKRGRTIGFPTVNQLYPNLLIKPPFGVYESEITVNGVLYKGVTNLGIRPTYKTDYVSCETYIISYNGNAYGSSVDLRLCRFIRPERRFESLEKLKSAIDADVRSVCTP